MPDPVEIPREADPLERLPLNEHLIARIQKSVKIDAGIEVSALEVLAVHNGDWSEARTAESRAIERALTEYGLT